MKKFIKLPIFWSIATDNISNDSHKDVLEQLSKMEEKFILAKSGEDPHAAKQFIRLCQQMLTNIPELRILLLHPMSRAYYSRVFHSLPNAVKQDINNALIAWEKDPQDNKKESGDIFSYTTKSFLPHYTLLFHILLACYKDSGQVGLEPLIARFRKLYPYSPFSDWIAFIEIFALLQEASFNKFHNPSLLSAILNKCRFFMEEYKKSTHTQVVFLILSMVHLVKLQEISYAALNYAKRYDTVVPAIPIIKKSIDNAQTFIKFLLTKYKNHSPNLAILKETINLFCYLQYTRMEIISQFSTEFSVDLFLETWKKENQVIINLIIEHTPKFQQEISDLFKFWEELSLLLKKS